MWLADTSVWIEHLRLGRTDLSGRLGEGLVLIHPLIYGELACGNLKNRTALLSDLKSLQSAVLATDDEVMELIEDRNLWGRGIGWVDAHLLAAALLSRCTLWTLDRRLLLAAKDLAVA